MAAPTVLPLRRPWLAYLALTKPRIIELLLVTTVPAMVVAASGWPGTGLVFATVLGGALTAAGANVLNNVWDRDIDEKMTRTRHRPIPRGAVTPDRARWLGWGLGWAGAALLWVAANPLASAIAFSALLFYVLVYTRRLKRATVQNIVIGGAAGAAPALVGWAAVTGRLDLPAWIMFAIVFAWTPAHFWALALRYTDDYARAGVPMLPVVRGAADTVRRISSYVATTVLFSLALVPVASMGWIYLGAAVVLGGWLLVDSVRLWRRPEQAMVFFLRSNRYLAGLFLAMMLDRLLA
ncbi:MAG: hypothetical protein KatS3mg011_0264 [Acidimicrobiia bacterium]|nr:MAG: hypothetical protein KatS3mg011_0264 [Acidimicrobiia bacterium]